MDETAGRVWNGAREHLISWRSWRGDAQFGWFAYAPPRWWPRGEKAQVVAVSIVAVGVKLYRGLCPLPVSASVGSGRDVWGGTSTAWGESRWEDDCARFALWPVRHPLEWIPNFEDFRTVAGLVGRGFEAYVRVLHPMVGHGPEQPPSSIRWHDLPDARRDEPGWRPDRLEDGGIDFGWGDGQLFLETRLQEPDESYLEELLRDDLRARGFTGDVIQAWWDGYGGSRLGEATPIRVHQPGRELIPFATSSFAYFAALEGQGPSLIFPADGSWVIACDIDLVSTYIGCSRALADAILAEEHLEVIEVAPGDPLG